MDASIDLIRAAFVALRADAELTALVGARIYDRAPADQSGEPMVEYPYISLGPTSSVPADADCIDGEEITLQFDVWSSGVDEAYATVECRKIADRVRRVLHRADLDLDVNALAEMTHQLTRVMSDPAPHIHHAAIQFVGVVELT